MRNFHETVCLDVPWCKESAIVNLDSNDGPGTHWVAFIKRRHQNIYFDSFGNLKPPLNLVDYFKSGKYCRIYYNNTSYQKFNTYNYGYLCLYFYIIR